MIFLLQPKLRSTALKALKQALEFWPAEVRPLIEGADEEFKGEAVCTEICFRESKYLMVVNISKVVKLVTAVDEDAVKEVKKSSAVIDATVAGVDAAKESTVEIVRSPETKDKGVAILTQRSDEQMMEAISSSKITEGIFF